MMVIMTPVAFPATTGLVDDAACTHQHPSLHQRGWFSSAKVQAVIRLLFHGSVVLPYALSATQFGGAGATTSPALKGLETESSSL